jgi:cell division septum initiation protein DivIVA
MPEDQKPDNDALDECIDTVHQLKDENQDLKEENQELRESADAFGELAERLAKTLRKERATGEERPTTTGDPTTDAK